MNCYIHHEKHSVGICRSCGRGLCPDCVVEVDDSLSCAGRCEEQVRTMSLIVKRDSQHMASSDTILRSTGVFTAIVGAIMTIFGIAGYLMTKSFMLMFIPFVGLVFLIHGINRLRKGAIYSTALKEDE